MTTPLSDERIAEIRAREQAATPGPWWADHRSYRAEHGPEYEVCTEGGRGVWTAHCHRWPDTDFIAAARRDVPALLDEVERLDRKSVV